MNESLKALIASSKRVVFFGGAGLSTESGIPDFRSENGIYRTRQEYGVSPEEILSHSYFVRHPETFFDYFRKFLLFPDAKPNAAHRALAKLEAGGRLSAIVTQNIDGLHQLAGSKRVLELHGSVHRHYCMSCGKSYELSDVLRVKGFPRCTCGGVIRPDVVLYEESLDYDVMSAAISEISKADLLIVGGTSLVVYPAAGLLDYFGGDKLAVINLSPTGRDRQATLCLREKIGQALSLDDEDI